MALSSTSGWAVEEFADHLECRLASGGVNVHHVLVVRIGYLDHFHVGSVISQSFCESGGDARLRHELLIVAPHQ